MTYELGRARFILEADGDDLLREQSKVYNEVTTQARKLTKELAKEIKVRQSDVRGAASVLIQEERKAAQERIKLDKAAAQDRKRTTQELIKYNQQQYKEDLRNWQQTLKERDTAEKQALRERNERARRIQREEAQIERDRLREVQRNVRDEATLRRQGAVRRREEETAARRAEALQNREQRQRGGSFGLPQSFRGIPGDIATIAGFGAIASGAIIVREALVTLVEATTKQEQAQRALNASFGESATRYKTLADSYASQFKRINSDVEQSTASFGVLQKQSNLTSAQIEKLIPVALDLQAAYGGDLREAFRSVAAAILGETEALEKYGIVLQENVLKTSPLLTEDERKNFSSLSATEQQLIRYRVAMELATKAQGAAAKQAAETKGGFDGLRRGVDELAKSLGTDLVREAGKAAGELGQLLEKLAKYNELSKERFAAQQAAFAANAGRTRPLFGIPGLPEVPQETTEEDIQRQIQAARQRKSLEEAARANEDARRRAQEDAQKAENARVDAENARNKRNREIILAELEDAARRRQRELDEQIKVAEAEKTAKLDALEETQRSTLRSLEDTENARQAAHELEVARVNKEKDVRIKANEDQKRSTLERIEVEQEAAEDAAKEQIRLLEIERDNRKRANEDTRDNELKRLELEHEALQKTRREEDRTIESSNRERERKAESIHKNTLHRLELEKESLQDAAKKAERAIDKRAQKEDDRHTKALRDIEDKQKKEDDSTEKRIKNNEREYDRQIEAIKAVQRERERLNRLSDLQERIGEAQLNLRRATGSQDPAAGLAAREKLTSAIRIGNPEAIKKAQDELVEIVGQGTEAIAEAQKELAKTQKDLVDQNLEDNENAQIELLEKQKDAEAEQLKATKERVDKQNELERRQEDDRHKRRTRDLDNEKQAQQDKLAASLRTIERQEERENARYDNEKDQIADSVRNAREKLEEKRKDEDTAYERSQEVVRERYEAEQRNIADTYDGEEHGYIPTIKRALDKAKGIYEQQKKDAEQRYRDEQQAIYNTYDDPEKGLLAILARNETEAKNSYQRIVDDTRKKYEDARQAVERAYKAPDGKSGIIDQLENMKKETEQKLQDVHEAFENASKGLVGPGGVITKQWADALTAANKYFDEVKRRGSEQITPRTIQTPRQSPGENNQGGDIPDGGGGGRSGSGRQTNQPVQAPAQTSRDTGGDDRTPVSVNVANGKVVLAASGNSYWTASGTHYVEGATDNAGAADIFGPIGTPIYAPTNGKVSSFYDRSGGNAAILAGSDGRYYYLAHGAIPFVRGNVTQGMQIGQIGDTGSAKGTSPHLHMAIATAASVFDRLQGKGNIKGDSSLWDVQRRDAGYLFRNPTSYQDMITGERGVLAELGPERLLGRSATRAFETVLTSGTNVMRGMFDAGSLVNGQNVERNTSIGGDTLVYNGVAPENMIRQWQSHQKDRSLLRGISGLFK